MATGNKNGGGTAVATRPAKEVAPLKDDLMRIQSRLASVLDGRISAEKQIQVVAIMAHSNEKLANCERSSLQMAMIRASSYGLSLDPAAQEAFLIPRWDKKLNKGKGGYLCHFQIGYQGLRKLLLRSGEIAAIETALVYEGEPFVYRRTEAGLTFLHEPDCFGRADRVVRGAYSYATLKSGLRVVEAMSTEEINKIRDKVLKQAERKNDDGSAWRPDSPWDEYWGEMARKTVLKRNGKSLPRSDDYDKAVQHDNEIYEQVANRVVASLNATPGRGITALRHQIALQEQAAPEPSFDAAAGVSQPLRSEADPNDYDDLPPEDVDYDDAGDVPPAREPGMD